MKVRIINAPTPELVSILRRRLPPELRKTLDEQRFDALGVVMVSVADLFYFADLAQKRANVMVSEVFGSCPQHITTLAVWGETSAVNMAMEAIEEQMGSGF